MATTTVPDISTLVPEVVADRVLEVFWSQANFAQDAERVDDLQGVRPGTVVSIGTFAAATPALNLAETEEIVPKKFTATKRSFTVGRIGDAYEYSYAAQTFSPQSLEQRASTYLGRAFAQRVDLNLTAAGLTDVPVGRKITATGTGPAAVITVANFRAAVNLFPDELRPALVAKLTQGQRDALTAEVMAGGTLYAGQTIWLNGTLDRLYGVPIETSGYLPTTTVDRAAGMLYLRNRTFVAAPAVDPLIEFVRMPLKATIDVVMNAWWAGGVQEPSTLAVIDAAR